MIWKRNAVDCLDERSSLIVTTTVIASKGIAELAHRSIFNSLCLPWDLQRSNAPRFGEFVCVKSVLFPLRQTMPNVSDVTDCEVPLQC